MREKRKKLEGSQQKKQPAKKKKGCGCGKKKTR